MNLEFSPTCALRKHLLYWKTHKYVRDVWRSRDINTSDLSFVQFIYSTIQRVSSLFPSFKFVNFADFIHYFDSLLRTQNAASSYLHWIVSNEWTGQSPLFYFTFSSFVEFIDFFPFAFIRTTFFPSSFTRLILLPSLWNRIPFMYCNNFRSFIMYSHFYIYIKRNGLHEKFNKVMKIKK